MPFMDPFCVRLRTRPALSNQGVPSANPARVAQKDPLMELVLLQTTKILRQSHVMAARECLIRPPSLPATRMSVVGLLWFVDKIAACSREDVSHIITVSAKQ